MVNNNYGGLSHQEMLHQRLGMLQRKHRSYSFRYIVPRIDQVERTLREIRSSFRTEATTLKLMREMPLVKVTLPITPPYSSSKTELRTLVMSGLSIQYIEYWSIYKTSKYRGFDRFTRFTFIFSITPFYLHSDLSQCKSTTPI